MAHPVSHTVTPSRGSVTQLMHSHPQTEVTPANSLAESHPQTEVTAAHSHPRTA